ncbi:MAG TPA: hypothetical protein VK601_08660 [Kofleriaceae bacterium]|nr:hypothetical protein [Kofleriaceae bacterium]
MRIKALSGSLTSLLVVGVLGAPAHAEPERVAAATVPAGASLSTGELRLTGAARSARKDAFLDARAVAAEVRPYAPEIERCYVDHLDDVRRAGRLDLTLVIGRDGYLVSLAASAPGLPSRAANRVVSCIRDAIQVLHFPARRNDTTAIVPYYFQHTETAGGGPQLSCWNPKGC